MKFSTTALLSASAALALVNIPLKDYFPECSIKCLEDSARAGPKCEPTDGECVCVFENYVLIVDAATACVMQACGADAAVNKVLPAAADFCSAVTKSAEAGGAEATPAPTNSGSDSKPSGTDAQPTGTAQTTSAATGGSQSSSSSSSSSSGSQAAAGATQTSTSAPAPTNGAAKGSAGYIAMLGLGALAVL